MLGLGLGSQVWPRVEHRFSMPWSKRASRMREIVRAIKAIFDCWEGRSQLDFRGEFHHHTLMIPAFDPGPNPFGPPPIFIGGFGPLMTAVAGETADGFFAHPFKSRESLQRNTLPALQRGLMKAGFPVELPLRTPLPKPPAPVRCARSPTRSRRARPAQNPRAPGHSRRQPG